MNIRRLWVKLALLFVMAAAVGFAIPTTLAYITAQSDTLVNTFDAPYFPPAAANVEVRVHKTVRNIGTESISPEDFRFMLQDTQSGEAFTLITDANGYAAVTLPFSDADLGKTHTYRLYEMDDARENVIYSDAVYTIEITLTVDAQNRIVASASMNGKPVQQIVAEFENIGNAGGALPHTGDTADIRLYVVLMLISAAGMIILLPKRNGCVRK